MTEYNFYKKLWITKKSKRDSRSTKRDWLHNYVIDRLINIYENDRIEVASRIAKGGERILDLGVWGGEFLNLQLIKQKYIERYGLDITEEAIKECTSKGILNVRFWNLNEFPYPFEDHFFDTISMLAVLEHLFDPYAVIDEIGRILRPGGQLILALPNVASFSNRIRLLLGKLPETSSDPGWDGGHLHYFTISAAKILLTDKGFQIDKIDISGGGRRLRLLFPNLLAGEFLISAVKK